MFPKVSLLTQVNGIYDAARRSDDGQRCMVAPHPSLQITLQNELKEITSSREDVLRSMLKMGQGNPLGFNDGVIVPPNQFPLGTPPSMIRAKAAMRAPLRGTLRVIVVLVEFPDQTFDSAHTKEHFERLFFSHGAIATKSVREYFEDVTHGLIDIEGEVVGPFRMPRSIRTYANGESGTGFARPNAQTMARDAVIACDPEVGFAQYDNDGDGFVDAFIVVHAGPAGEVTGNPNHIWSHKWVLDGGALSVDNTNIFAYLTVPEDAKIGVCCHELGHLLFGFPDLYDSDYTSQGIGDWCLMAGGSWGGGGDTPCHPSAWCKANQGWAAVENVEHNVSLSIDDVKNSQKVYRLWKNGEASTEYFLVENRQRSGFDTSLPSEGLLVWHIDDTVSSNTNEFHYKVALVQADDRRDLEQPATVTNQGGDAGDPYPGTRDNREFTNTSRPNSKAYNGQSSGVSITQISDSGPTMTAIVQVRPGTVPTVPSGITPIEQLTSRVEALENAVAGLTSVRNSDQRFLSARRSTPTSREERVGETHNMVRDAAKEALLFQD